MTLAQLLAAPHDEWLMHPSDRLVLVGLLSLLRPACAIEIGAHRGRATAVLSSHCERVVAVDVNPAAGVAIEAAGFSNVECVIGDSAAVLPALLDRLGRDGGCDFALVDGDHSAAGVRADLQCFLCRPRRPCYLLMHDSFNPECRSGIGSAGWQDCPYVHSLNLDLVSGYLSNTRRRTRGKMWGGGGLALAVLTPEPRSVPLEIANEHASIFANIVPHSRHASLTGKLSRLLTRQ